MKKRVAIRLSSFIASVSFALTIVPAGAADPPYLDQLPAVDRVLADHQGADRLDTLARQEAALNQLTHAISLLGGGSETRDEQNKRGEYGTVARKLHSEALAMLSNEKGGMPWSKSPRDDWRAKQATYERDPALVAATYQRYMPAEVREQLGVEAADFDARFYGESDTLPSRYGELGPTGKAAVQIVAYGLLLWLVLIVVRELRPFGARKSNPLLVDAGFRLYRLHFFTGTVTDYASRTETVKRTTTETDDFGNSRTTYFSRTYFHETFTLAGSRGEHHVHVTDAHVAPTVGHVFTAVWAVRRFRKGGHYVLFFDRTQPATKALETTIRWLLSLRLVMFIPVIGLTILGALAAIAVLQPSGSNEPAILFMSIIAAMIVAALLFVQTNKRRGRRFIKNDAPRILAAIEKAEPPGAGSLVTQGAA
jgi:hypothetical protein